MDLQPKNAVFDHTVVDWLQLFFSRKAVADRLQYMCDRGLYWSRQQRVFRCLSSLLFNFDITKHVNYTPCE